jgi:Flp pilus assembly protein TadD
VAPFLERASARSGSRVFLAALLLALAACRQAPEVDRAAFVRAMNLGEAHLENREADPAVASFQAALAADPASLPARRNLARALLLARRDDEALATLAAAGKGGDGSAATPYLKGLALARRNRFAEAIGAFEEAVALDPGSAPLRFQLANAYQAEGRNREAEEQLRETLRLDPLHATAVYRLARYAASRGDRRQAAEWTARFAHLRQVLGEGGRSAEELERSAYTPPEPAVPGPPAGPPEPPLLVRFTDATAAALASGVPAVAAAVLEVAPDGRPTLAAAGADGAVTLLAWGDGAFAATPAMGPGGKGAWRHAAAGDYFDPVPEGRRFDPAVDARNDLLLVGPAGSRLLLRSGPASFADVTGEAGLAGARGERARWADVDEDGDLDLLVAGPDGLGLWRNDGDGGFTAAGPTMGVEVAGAVVDVVAGDRDEDLAVDLLAARGDGGTLLLRGGREGRFTAGAQPPGPWPPARRLLVDDLEDDGTLDAVFVRDGEVEVRLLGRGRRQVLPAPGLTPAAAVLFDFDNDGWQDLAVAGRESGGAGSSAAGEGGGRGRVLLWRNGGAAGWSAAGAATGLDALTLPAPADLLAADVDADGDSDLVVVGAAGGLTLLRNDGGDANGQLKVRLLGTKSNPSGLGARVEVTAGDFRAVRRVGALPVEIGVGSRSHLDAVATVWTNGVVQNQIDLDLPGGPLEVVEKNVATGSCPFLYAWDGAGFRFVTDLLGNAPLGLPLRRRVMLPADPEELVVIGGPERLVPRGGSLLVAVTSEFREVLYLDQARLLAVDHPPEVEVASPDRLGPPPFPPSEPWALAHLVPPRSAVGDDGVDRTAAVAASDGVFAPPGRPLPPPYRGVTEPLALTLDFGPLDRRRPLVLALTGWLQYGDASTNIALSQDPRPLAFPPRLEVETTPGRWRPLAVTVGLPAGKTKTILVDLGGRLPPGARRLRLLTAQEVRWDRIALGERVAGTALAVHSLAPASAELRFRGFSELSSRAPGAPTTPDYLRVAARPPWRGVLEGWSTRYGAVDDLVRERDGRLVVVNAGDELRLAFAAAELPPPPPGRVRTFLLATVGWDKDGDPNVAGGDRVEPLPGQEATAPGDDWQARTLTRWVPRDRFAGGG